MAVKILINYNVNTLQLNERYIFTIFRTIQILTFCKSPKINFILNPIHEILM